MIEIPEAALLSDQLNQSVIGKEISSIESDLYGEPGGYATIMSRKTVREPCPVCGTTIRKASYLGGSVYFCVTCQAI